MRPLYSKALNLSSFRKNARGDEEGLRVYMCSIQIAVDSGSALKLKVSISYVIISHYHIMSTI